ncbi:MAG: DUF1553 domain-containing protein [Verrucomicrobia bacterium]|nr:DUF1553 domain-containing protein [Verrucomicrobiota bacterium]
MQNSRGLSGVARRLRNLFIAALGLGSALAAPAPVPGADGDWWALQPVRATTPPAPEGAGWCRNEIDRFVLQKLAGARLQPSPEAGRAVLIRRIFFDMLGLPPTHEEIRAFVNDKSEGAYSKLIERVLASSRYGERWARFWLDLVRYADSDGFRYDDYRPNAWRYRDYVIDAFNRDKPYDRFVREQIAGDELYPGDPGALVATGYLRHWTYEYNMADLHRQRARILDDITDTTSDVFLALSLQCARCHDHKSDPLRREDYYRLQAFFAPLVPRDDLTVLRGRALAEHGKKQQAWERATATIRREMESIEREHRSDPATGRLKGLPEDIQRLFTRPEKELTPLERQLADLAARELPPAADRLRDKLRGADKDRLLALEHQLEKFHRLKPPALPMALAAGDAGPIAPALCIPGKRNLPVKPGFPAVLDPTAPDIHPPAGVPESTGRRAALATWLTRPENPLTARIIVNRVWQQHFGRGLAANTSDFGHDSGLPSHPELLDWLAARFVRDGWSLKTLHRLILTSATYRQDSSGTPAGNQYDPENRLLARAPIRRLDAEQARDAILAVSGALRLDSGGPAVNAAVPRRTIYTRAIRNSPDPLLDVFDAPQPVASVCSRITTTTTAQSLWLLNSQPMIEAAKKIAQRVGQRGKDADRISRAYWIIFGRAPGTGEIASAENFLRSQLPRIDPVECGSPAASFLRGQVPSRGGWAADFSPDGSQRRLEIPHSSAMPRGDFTIEAYLLLRAFDGRREPSHMPIVGKWDGDRSQGGWELCIYQPSTDTDAGLLALRMAERDASGKITERTYYSNLRINTEKAYYVAATVKLAGAGPGAVGFHVQDLPINSNKQVGKPVPIPIRDGITNFAPLVIGASASSRGVGFDGLIDEIRLTDGCLPESELLCNGNESHPKTAGYWRFEPVPGVFRDSGPRHLDIRPPAQEPMDRTLAPFVDLCHVLLISNEFLYID